MHEDLDIFFGLGESFPFVILNAVKNLSIGSPLAGSRIDASFLSMTNALNSLCHSERSEESIDRLTSCRFADRCFVPQHDNALNSLCHSERSEESIDRLTSCRFADRCFVPQHDKRFKHVSLWNKNRTKTRQNHLKTSKKPLKK